MNRIVKRHYPVSKLPDDLREGIDDAGHVTVTVEPEEALAEPAMTLEEIFEATRHIRERGATTTEDAVARVRELRDEWSEREERTESLRRKLRAED